jgi:hypothetical protein
VTEYPVLGPGDVRVAKSSRRPPAMLHANREARYEGMWFYIVARFEICESDEERWVYYNPEADIVFFRRRTSTDYTMTKLFRTALTIPRVAVEFSDPINSENSSYEMSDVDARMRALSGYTQMAFFTPSPAKMPGCKGLQEIFWVLEADGLDPKFDVIDECVQIRPFDPREIAWGWTSANFMKEYAEEHNWAGKHFTSRLCLNPASGKIYQRILLYLTKHEPHIIISCFMNFIKTPGCEVGLSDSGRVGWILGYHSALT